MTDAPDLSALIKSYDVRGIVGDTLTAPVARAIGEAFADAIVLPEGGTTVAIGHDMRDSGPWLADAVAEGLTRRGVDVVRIGLCSTDGLYHASGALDLPGVMITASHNPAEYNGMKMCRSRARAVGENSGLADVRETAARYLVEEPPAAATPGTESTRDMIGEYGAFLRSLVPLDGIRPLKVVVDAANAMAGYTVPAVLGTEAGLPELPLEIIPLYFELDGTFPNHEANPLDSSTLVDLQAAVREHGADIGLAFDGDADRCFVIDERGEVVTPSTITCLVGLRETARELASGGQPTVIHNLISSRAVREQLAAAGATPVRSRVGHSFIKAEMARLNAIFGGEHSGHFYFRDFWYADSGMIAAMHVLAALGTQDRPLSEMLTAHDPYVASGEINSKVDSVPAALARVKEAFVTDDVYSDEFDGLTVEHWPAPGEGERWWFNVRPSNTEPLLRLNSEADGQELMERMRDRVLAVIRQG
ncbi:phosphomannomutase/phosphoglucomutase [Demequina lignilytica]|uniref:Phosphomannomutase/phosphoglucomutase n=1 Tax=Demequina lignilytica TaxID=3051663 RepID=A0AB35MG07_9MICO|nr:phosphomannomutase/phosphoglucomutase [Demequina sp. SYSU T0a273]MDN4482655.1 phosphomannomutase/phosphoglucomutase [Demequina sp. SYSU T0a273]